MQFFVVTASLILAGLTTAKTQVGTVWGPMNLTAISSNSDINDKPIQVTTDGTIVIGGSGKNLTTMIDSSDKALYTVNVPLQDGNIQRIYLDNGEWKLSATATPVLSPASFTNTNYLTIGGKQLGYACKASTGYSVHWGQTPTCSGSSDLSLLITFHA